MSLPEKVLIALKNVTINEDQRLFVIACGDGCACLGFDNARSRIKSLSAMLFDKVRNDKNKYALLDEALKSEIGTVVQFGYYLAVSDIAADYELGTFFHEKTVGKVRKLLDQYRLSGDKVRVFYGHEDGRDWLEENDVIFRVGRSGGSMKVPLAILDGENGGSAILDDRIIRIIDVKSGKEVYRHKDYRMEAELNLMKVSDDSLKNLGYTFSVFAGDILRANFKKLEDASHYIAFLTGKSFVTLEC